MPSRTRALFRLSGPVKLLGGCLTHMKIPNTKCGKKKKWPSVDLGVKVEECWSCEARRPGTSGRVLSPQRDHRITLAAPRICGPRGGHRMLCPYIFFDLLKRYITLHIAPVVFIIDNNLELY